MRAVVLLLVVSTLAGAPLEARDRLNWQSFDLGMSFDQVGSILDAHRLRWSAGTERTRIETDRPLLREVFESQRARFLFDDGERLGALRIEITPRRGAEPSEIVALWRDGRAALVRQLGRATREETPSYATAEELVMAIWGGGSDLFIEWNDDSRSIRFRALRKLSSEIVLELLVTSAAGDRLPDGGAER